MKKTKLQLLAVLICAVSLLALIFTKCENDQPWNQAYLLPSEAHPEDIDILLSLPADTFPSHTETILVTATNTNGKDFQFIGHLFLEKQTASGWKRLPYFEETPFTYRMSVNASAKMGFDSQYFQRKTTLTAGRYRFVLYIENQAHHIEFDIQ